MDSQQEFLAHLEAHKKILYKVASLYCANAQDRQDLMQETAVQLWRSYERFDGRSTFATWMYRVALNVAISWVRDDSHHQRHLASDPGVIETALADEAAKDAPPELRVFLTEVLASLNELDRALVLLYLEGHDQEAIAAILGLSSTNVATKINRIKQRLQREHGGSDA
jgi:RNA polymerase sigma factor (sigma-70 family)